MSKSLGQRRGGRHGSNSIHHGSKIVTVVGLLLVGGCFLVIGKLGYHQLQVLRQQRHQQQLYQQYSKLADPTFFSPESRLWTLHSALHTWMEWETRQVNDKEAPTTTTKSTPRKIDTILSKLQTMSDLFQNRKQDDPITAPLIPFGFGQNKKNPNDRILTRELSSSSSNTVVKPLFRIGVYVQLGNGQDPSHTRIPDITTCLANVASAVAAENQSVPASPNPTRKEPPEKEEATNDTSQTDVSRLAFDLHVATRMSSSEQGDQKIEDDSDSMKLVQFWQDLFHPTHTYLRQLPFTSSAADGSAFWAQLQQYTPREYDLVLKLSDAAQDDDLLQERIFESLCGTPEQVQSIWNAILPSQPRSSSTSRSGAATTPTLVAPMGTIFGPQTALTDIFPHLVDKYHWRPPPKTSPNSKSTTISFPSKSAFGSGIVRHLNDFKRKLLGDGKTFLRASQAEEKETYLAVKRLQKKLLNLQQAGDFFGEETKDAMMTLTKKLDEAKRSVEEQMEDLDERFGDFREQDLSLVAGRSYWINAAGLRPQLWSKHYESLHDELLSTRFHDTSALESVIERIIPTFILHEGGALLDIQPAPRPMALYNPQFEANTKDEWASLKNHKALPGTMTFQADVTLTRERNETMLQKPLSVQEGGLGYYDLQDSSIRQQQGSLARQYGLGGFCIHHFWPSKKGGNIVQSMLRDGQPNMPFVFTWMDGPLITHRKEPKRRRSVQSSHLEWTQHYEYLVPFFKNPNYVRVNDAPVFIINHVGPKKSFVPMVQYWQHLARERGDFSNGLHIVQSVGNSHEADRYGLSSHERRNVDAQMDGSYHSWPGILPTIELSQRKTTHKTLTASVGNVPNLGATLARAQIAQDPYMTPELRDTVVHPSSSQSHHEYWGAFTGLDRRAHDLTTMPLLRSPREFQKGVCESFLHLALYRNRTIGTNLYFVSSWNEWNEGSVLEPSDLYHYEYLQALQHCLRHVPVSQVRAVPMEDDASNGMVPPNKKKKKRISLWKQLFRKQTWKRVGKKLRKFSLPILVIVAILFWYRQWWSAKLFQWWSMVKSSNGYQRLRHGSWKSLE